MSRRTSEDIQRENGIRADAVQKWETLLWVLIGLLLGIGFHFFFRIHLYSYLLTHPEHLGNLVFLNTSIGTEVMILIIGFVGYIGYFDSRLANPYSDADEIWRNIVIVLLGLLIGMILFILLSFYLPGYLIIGFMGGWTFISLIVYMFAMKSRSNCLDPVAYQANPTRKKGSDRERGYNACKWYDRLVDTLHVPLPFLTTLFITLILTTLLFFSGQRAIQLSLWCSRRVFPDVSACAGRIASRNSSSSNTTRSGSNELKGESLGYPGRSETQRRWYGLHISVQG